MITGYATQITELHFTLNRQHFRLRSFASLCLDCPVFWGDRRSFQIRYASHFYPGLAMIFLRDRFCLSAASLSRQHDILDFSCCPLSRVLHMTLAPICKNLDLSFIWGHHHLRHSVDGRSINRLHNLLHRANETQQGRNSCQRVQFLTFSLNSIMFYVVSALHHCFSFLCMHVILFQ